MGLVEITYDGVDIADDVLYRTAAFESQLAAIPGMFEMTVKDVNQTHDFVTGKEVTLSVDGTRYWGGYLTQVEEFYATIVDTSVPADVVVRQWLLRGVDYNILFDKRVLANYASPTSGVATFDIGTMDGDAITYMINHYLDVADDGLDLSGIDNVAVVNEDAKGKYGVPGEKWRQTMIRFANSTGATWYIDANKRVVNREREDDTVAWGFSDVPDDVTYFGSREIRYTLDGSSVVNDALIWGGDGFTGSVKFGRVENTDSIAAGLRMQFGATHFNDTAYASNNSCRIHASVIVKGSPGTVAIVGNGPDSDRGLQNPQQLLSQAWFYGGVPTALVPGTVVTTRLFTFGAPKIITLPLRALRITFLAPEIIRFDGSFGIQTSDPYSLWAYMKRQADEQQDVVYAPPIPDTAPDPTPGGTFTTTNVAPLPDGSTTVFTLRFPYLVGSTRVYRNGLLLVRGTDYTESDPENAQITMATAPSESDVLYVTATSSGVVLTGSFPGFAAADAAVSAGGVVYVPAGTYHESFTLSTPGVTWYCSPDVIIDLSGFSIATQASGVNITGDDISFLGEAQICNSSASGITVDGDRVTITTELHHNAEQGYVWHGTDGTVLEGSNHHNNSLGGFWDSGEQGAGKANADNLTIDGCHVYDIGKPYPSSGADTSSGQGLWWDSISSPPLSRFSSGTVRNCVIERCYYNGVMFEVSDTFSCHDNIVHHCGWTPSGSGFWGAGILISSSRNVEVYNNLVAYNTYSGIRVLCQTRGDKPGITTNVKVHGNTLIRNGADAISVGNDDNSLDATMFGGGSGNEVYANVFNVNDLQVYWKPSGTLTSLSAINALPGGGGSTTITETQADTILGTYGITP